MFSKKKLWVAIENGQVVEALSLIKNASNVNDVYSGIENENECSFLLQALNRGQVDVVLALLDKGADASIYDKNGHGAIFYFVKSGLYPHTYLIERLIERGADINKRIGGYTLLCLSFLKMPKLVSFLLKRKADVFEAPYIDEKVHLDLFFPVEVVAYRDLPYLSLAILNKDEEAFNYLIRFSEILNAVDSYGRTPIMVAALQGNGRLALSLVNAGAFLDIKDFAGRSVYDYFKNMADKKYQNLLIAGQEQNSVGHLLDLILNAKEFSVDFNEIEEKEDKKVKNSFWSKIKNFLGMK